MHGMCVLGGGRRQGVQVHGWERVTYTYMHRHMFTSTDTHTHTHTHSHIFAMGQRRIS